MINLYQGDCLTLMHLIPAQSVDLVLCDLPYGTTACKWDSVIPFEPLWAHYKRICKGAVVLTAAQPFTSFLITSNPREFKYSWIWKKEMGTGFGNCKRQPLRNHEDVVVFYSQQCVYNPQMSAGKAYKRKSNGAGAVWADGGLKAIETIKEGSRYPVTVIDFQRDRNKIHPTQKPVALMEYLIRTYTNEGDTVLDNCMGSGTTGVACVNSGRSFIGIEQDAKYFEIAKQRIQAAR